MADFKKVADLSEIGEGQILTAEVNGTAVALYKVNGQVFATMESCPPPTGLAPFIAAVSLVSLQLAIFVPFLS